MDLTELTNKPLSDEEKKLIKDFTEWLITYDKNEGKYLKPIPPSYPAKKLLFYLSDIKKMLLEIEDLEGVKDTAINSNFKELDLEDILEILELSLYCFYRNTKEELRKLRKEI